MSDLIYYLFAALVVLVAIQVHARSSRRRSQAAAAKLQESIEQGMIDPASLHPVVDLKLCMGAAACVSACPEKALGIIDRKGVLINPTHCIGHAACAPACPVGAIKLVFGTERRGVEIPTVTPSFETNVPGIFIAGELGGMGLIRNAVRQGTQAVSTIASRPRASEGLDLIIVGAGPAGIAASLAAESAGLKYVTVEQEESLGGTTYHYPRNKLVMTAPMKLPLVGSINARELTKEQLMEIWQGVLDKARPDIRFRELMQEIVPESGRFTVKTSRDTYRAAHVLLAIGRRGTPRKLGVPGEEQPKVVYRLIDAAQYRGKHVLVVGGGDSALEAALSVSEEADTTVTLSYRGRAFDRVKPKNRERLAAAIDNGRIDCLLESRVREIGRDTVIIERGGDARQLRNDALIVCAGGELPTPMLKRIGIKVEAHYGI